MTRSRPNRDTRGPRPTVLLATHADRTLALARAFANRGCPAMLAFSPEQLVGFAASAGVVVTDASTDPDASAMAHIANPATVTIFVSDAPHAPTDIDMICAEHVPVAEIVTRALELNDHREDKSIAATRLVWGGLTLDTSRRESRWHHEPLALTATQFDILAALVEARGAVVSKEQLRIKLWPAVLATSSSERLLAHVRRIRKFVEADPSRPEFLLTVRGVGFRLADPYRNSPENSRG